MKKNQSPYYHAIAQEEIVFEKAYESKIPFLLKGPTGTGKSRFVEYIAHKLNKKLITISCHEETSSKLAYPWIQKLARDSRFVFVTEPARANGALVNKRKST